MAMIAEGIAEGFWGDAEHGGDDFRVVVLAFGEGNFLPLRFGCDLEVGDDARAEGDGEVGGTGQGVITTVGDQGCMRGEYTTGER